MDARQQHYLKAMGITVWQRRDLPSEPGPYIEPLADPLPKPVPELASEPLAAAVEESQPQPVAHFIQNLKPVPVTEVPQPVESTERFSEPLVPCGDWAGLQQQVDDCQQCALYKTRMNAVFGTGQRQADWMIIGDAPGADEDKRNEPFVGEAGLLLNAMLQAVGLKREAVYLTNSLKCRPPNNRPPKTEELDACSGFLRQQIELVQPRLIIALGARVAQSLLACEQEVAELRSRIHKYGEQQIPLLVTHHPAYLLQFPAEKRSSWEDLQLAMSVCQPGSPS